MNGDEQSHVIEINSDEWLLIIISQLKQIFMIDK